MSEREGAYNMKHQQPTKALLLLLGDATSVLKSTPLSSGLANEQRSLRLAKGVSASPAQVVSDNRAHGRTLGHTHYTMSSWDDIPSVELAAVLGGVTNVCASEKRSQTSVTVTVNTCHDVDVWVVVGGGGVVVGGGGSGSVVKSRFSSSHPVTFRCIMNSHNNRLSCNTVLFRAG